ncbi:transporter substrate-binding domain-containing protein [Brucella pituitosa]|uniref:transporter substrate-binding domain-containing protein n=1 Tax=Brucella pituitosa TaxID=571256 RepID=UPI0009A139E5|nr:transporter substrate-binding domain-containing protein [Brucella pituitosa]
MTTSTVIAVLLCSPMLFATSALAEKLPRLTIATEGYLRPYNFTRPDGELDGFDIELGRHLCKTMRVECIFVAQPFEGLLAGINAGKFDAIMAGLIATPERERVIAFSKTYSLTPQVFAVLKDSRFDMLPHSGIGLDLAGVGASAEAAIQDVSQAVEGAEVGVVKGTVSAAFVQQYFQHTVMIREYRSEEDALMDLKSGRIDIFANSRAFLTSTAKLPGYQDLRITGPSYSGGVVGRGVAVGVQKNNAALLDKFNHAITLATADGTIARLSSKWFEFNVSP